MKTKLSQLVVLLLASTMVLPAHIFAQTPTLPAQMEVLTKQLSESGSQFSLTTSTEIRNSISGEVVAKRLKQGTLKTFYTLAPFDPSIHAKLGTKFTILSRSITGVSILTEMMLENSKTNQLESFETPVKKLIHVNFNQSSVSSVKLDVNQAVKSSYAQAKRQSLESMGSIQKLKMKAAALISAAFMPEAKAELISEMVANTLWLTLFLIIAGTGSALVFDLWKIAKGGKEISKRMIAVEAAALIITILVGAAIVTYKNHTVYEND